MFRFAAVSVLNVFLIVVVIFCVCVLCEEQNGVGREGARKWGGGRGGGRGERERL